MSKEYTYDIDKYTIGVDTNGEDGIGLTVAKVENGEIHFLGNCYGENALCIDLLIKENKELKEQAEEYKDNYNCLLKQKEEFEYIMSKQVDYRGQQKEFINYLENEIQKKREKSATLTAYRRNVVPLQQCLQKYKEITGVSDAKEN